ncbi:uncharacterized protein LOC122981763 isoform X1 [Scomber scombrus]|uniref:Uncharacterized protein LOC122981763 isoform X1 n=1 Tax=Scomber scombrus TaxID=13677 RepID=A0AAV1PW20_SCOSC
MAALLSSVLLLLSGSVLPDPFAGPGPSTGSGPDSEQGRMQLRRVRSLATQSRYGECWARALENLDTRCKDMTSESQSQIALRFTHCHLSSTGRDFPSCPEGSEVSRCTAGMDAVAFNAYTEFFTHTHSICHFLQSEAWQSRAESTMHRLTESSAGVVEQLLSTRQMAEDLIEVQSAALQTQQEILNNGEELRVTLKDSTQGLKSVFSDLSSVSRQQQVALSELFNRVSFLQSFMMTEAHSLGSCLYNAAALCASFLLTSTQRTSKARLLLLAQVCLNFYLERKIWQYVMSSDHPEHKHMRPGAAESAGAAAAQGDTAQPAGGAAAGGVFRAAAGEDGGDSAECEENGEKKKYKRGDTEVAKRGAKNKRRGEGGGRGVQHPSVSDHR